MLSRLAISGNVWGGSTSSDVSAVHNYDPKKKTYSFSDKNVQSYGHWYGRSQQTPSAKGGKGKIQRLDWVSCHDMEIQVLPSLGITVDQV
jgi:hypothetical protein